LKHVIHQRQSLKKEGVKHFNTSANPYGRLKSSAEPQLKLDSLIEYNQNGETELWDEKFKKETFEYNEDHNEVLWVYSSWSDETNEWYDLMKEECDYYPNGKLSGYTNYVWGVNEEWNGFINETYQYDEANRIQESTKYAWKNSLENWIVTSITKYSYNNDNSLKKDSTYYWMTEPEDWSIQSKNEYTYIHGGLIHHIYRSEYNTASESWDFTEDIWYLYDNIRWDLHSITVFVSHEDEWMRKEMEGMSYNDNNYLYGSGKVEWNLTGEKPELTSMTKNYYDYNFNTEIEDIVLPSYLTNTYPLFFHHQVEGHRLYQRDLEANNWNQYRSINYYYSNVDKATIINNTQTNSFNLYPNPANDFVYVSFVEISQSVQFELFNSMGAKIMSVSVSANDQVDVSSITPGLYLYVIQQGNKKETGKIIIN